MDKGLTKEQREELQKLTDDLVIEAKKVRKDYKKNPSEISGSVVSIHENSPYLDTELNNDNPLYSGSRWTKVIKNT
jgi:hypothetical protein